jgi:hypothetical protein
MVSLGALRWSHVNQHEFRPPAYCDSRLSCKALLGTSVLAPTGDADPGAQRRSKPCLEARRSVPGLREQTVRDVPHQTEARTATPASPAVRHHRSNLLHPGEGNQRPPPRSSGVRQRNSSRRVIGVDLLVDSTPSTCCPERSLFALTGRLESTSSGHCKITLHMRNWAESVRCACRLTAGPDSRANAAQR